MVNLSSEAYNGSLTREQFLFYEMRTVAKLLVSGLTDEEALTQLVAENLFQYPTEKMVRNLARVCMKRLRSLNSEELVNAIANHSSDEAKQICLYAMMRQYRLVWEFMITVIGSKYQNRDMTYGKIDMNTFFFRLQEQDDKVASWSESTIKKIQQVLNRILVETEYIDSTTADHLNPVLLTPILENAIRANGDEMALPAFNCFL